MRLIDADRLKSYIDCGHLRPPTEVCFSELDVCNMVDKQPTIEAVQGWIPCSEGLPIENGRYLVTFPLFTLQRTWIDILWYGNPTMPNRRVKGKCWYRTDDEWGDVVYDEVTAWMPLPTPYKGGDDK